MTHDQRSVSDTQLERALGYRAATGSGDGLLSSIVSQARSTGQDRVWWPPTEGTRRVRLAWIAVGVATLLALGGLIASGLGGPRNDLSVVPPVPVRTSRPVLASPTPGPTSSPDTLEPAQPIAPIPPASPLPSTADGLGSMLPSRLCGVAATKRSYPAPSAFIPSTPKGPWFDPNVRATALADMLIAAGVSADRSLYIVASTADHAGPCPIFGVFRVIGADPHTVQAAFVDSTTRAGVPCAILRFGNRTQDVLDCHGMFLDSYSVFVGDAVFFVEASSDGRAASLLASLPDASGGAPAASPILVEAPKTYRSAFHVPFTARLDRHWSVLKDTANEVELWDSDYPMSFVTIGSPSGHRAAASLVKALRSLRLSYCGMANPMPARSAGLTGVEFSCYGEGKGDVRTIYPGFGLLPGEYATVFIADVGNTPVVIIVHGNVGQFEFFDFASRAKELLRSVRFHP